jgi:microcystin-dependent protein
MSYLGQIKIFAFPYAPLNWEFCQGKLLPTSQYTSLFSLLGNTYGGDGRTNFALPNLKGIPVGAGQAPGGSNYPLGERGGEAAVTLAPNQLPAHNHAFNTVGDQANSATPAGNQPAWSWKQAANDTVIGIYAEPPSPTTALARNAIATSGSGRPHNNLQPYVTLNFSIATAGVWPQRDGPPVPADRPFTGEIAICAFGNPPAGWTLCEGQLMQIAQNQQLFSLIGATYGGDAVRTFALPDLRGRVPLNFGENFAIGQRGGEEARVLSESEMPAHSHALMANATSQRVGPQAASITALGTSLGKQIPLNTPFTANLYSTAGANAQQPNYFGCDLGGIFAARSSRSLPRSSRISRVARNRLWPWSVSMASATTAGWFGSGIN